MLRFAIFLLECVFSGVFLWLGLYLITRDQRGQVQQPRWWWQRAALSTGIAHVCVAWYLVGAGMQVVADEPTTAGLWVRLTYWALPLACATVFHGILLVTTPADHTPRAGYVASALLFVCSSVIAVASVTTDLFYRFEAVRPTTWRPNYLQVPPRAPFFIVEGVLIMGALLATTVLAFRRYFTLRDAARRQFRWIGVAAGLQAAGALTSILGLSFPSRVNTPPKTGDTILFVGIVLLGYGVAQDSALFRHQVITRDFFRALTGATLASTLFVLAFAGIHALTPATMTPESIPLLIWLAILTINLTPWVAARLDDVFLPRSAVLARRALTQAGNDLAVAEDQQDTLRQIEYEVPEVLAATRQDLELQELQERIAADINQLFRGTNYTRDDSERYIAINTGLLDLAVIEEPATALMVEEFDRDHYRLKVFQRTIAALVAEMAAEADAAAARSGEPDSDRHRRQRARATILQQQFLQDVPRSAVQQLIERRYYVGGGGGYGRLLLAAKQDLAKRLYLAERRARERRGASAVERASTEAVRAE
jgi:hypothetical protein